VNKSKTSYKDSGVDIDKANSFVERIKPLIKSVSRKEVMGGIGGFGSLFHIDNQKYKNPVLVSTTDGVGTKLKLAQMMDKHDTVGIDLVAMNVNDLIVQGAEPLFFLDYIATGKLDVEKNVSIIEGIVKGCGDAGCALVGGETAEMPGFYEENEYDLAGFCVGVVEYEKIIDGSEISVGDKIIGIGSSGVHSNGFSLVRKVVFDKAKLDINDKVNGLEDTIGMELLCPTKIYVKPLLNLIKNFTIKGMAHITGGGFIDNIPRILPERCTAVIDKESWKVPAVFRVIQDMGNIEEAEMFRVFNMGIGMVIIASAEESQDIVDRLGFLGERAFIIGSIAEKDEKRQPIVI
jgi:phosphoribosylformylglycinamidine cyclo-ligase